ncbi:MAG: iron ABC transporter permease [candidate division WOR-3 bacterium]|nr:iron ABC transporter permease [candidate division WOR-3 bacterium]
MKALRIKYLVMFLLIVCLSGIYLTIGSQWRFDTSSSIILSIRLPRLILALITGSVLALSGAIMQGILQNPLADPYLLGISGGAVLGTTVAGILFEGNIIVSVLFSFMGGLGAFFLTLFIAGISGGNRRYAMIIAGILIGSFASAGVAVLYIVFRQGISSFFYTVMGSLNRVFITGYIPLYITVCAIIVLLVMYLVSRAKRMEIISSGSDIAETSGIEVKKEILSSLVITAFIVSAVVAFTGIIGFVGIMVPHIVRRFVPMKFFHVYMFSLLGGALLLTGSDLIAKSVMSAEIPVGVITSLLGIPFFIYILKRGQDVQN